MCRVCQRACDATKAVAMRYEASKGRGLIFTGASKSHRPVLYKMIHFFYKTEREAQAREATASLCCSWLAALFTGEKTVKPLLRDVSHKARHLGISILILHKTDFL